MARMTPIVEKTRAEIEAIGSGSTACAGAVYRATDEKAVWFGHTDGTLVGPFVSQVNSPQFYGDHPSNAAAGDNQVPLGGIYFLTFDNVYGLPEGTAKKRTNQP